MVLSHQCFYNIVEILPFLYHTVKISWHDFVLQWNFTGYILNQMGLVRKTHVLTKFGQYATHLCTVAHALKHFDNDNNLVSCNVGTSISNIHMAYSVIHCGDGDLKDLVVGLFLYNLICLIS